MHGPRTEAVRGTGPNHFPRQERLARSAQLELRPALEDVPRLVLDVVELQAQRLAGLDDEKLAGVVLGDREDQLVTPGLLDLLRLGREAGSTVEVRGAQVMVIRHSRANLPLWRPEFRQWATRGSRPGAPPRRGDPSACSP